MLGSMVYTSFACALRVNAAWRTSVWFDLFINIYMSISHVHTCAIHALTVFLPLISFACTKSKHWMFNIDDSRGIGSRIYYSTIDNSCMYDVRFEFLFCGGVETRFIRICRGRPLRSHRDFNISKIEPIDSQAKSKITLYPLAKYATDTRTALEALN